MDMSNDIEFITHRRQQRRRRLVLWIVFAALLVCAAYVFFVWVPAISAVRPVADLVRVVEIEEENKPSHNRQSKLVIVGDVHGEYKPLKRLLKKAGFDQETDHLVLLGDFITKGDDSIKVLEYAQKVGASCVRGNHEDEIINMYAKYHRLPEPMIEGENETRVDYEDVPCAEGPYHKLNRDAKLVRALTPSHMAYITGCPLILQLGNTSALMYDGEAVSKKRKDKKQYRAVAVHAGLLWHIRNLEDQDPIAAMTVRSLLPPEYTEPSEEDDGRAWEKLWNKKQEILTEDERVVVYYGHAARYGLNLHDYTRGLDSGCVKGNRLSAAVLTQTKDGDIEEDIVSVSC